MFAPNAYARARLLRQMHACGLLADTEVDAEVDAEVRADVGVPETGAPH